MNTVKIGDNFEAKSKILIKEILDNHELSINPAHCTVFEKKKYYSVKRKREIIFDLVIEIKSPKADRPFLVCIIECKSLNKPVPVDDVEEFESKVSGIQEFQTKKIIIAKNGFQSGAFDTAKSLGITLIDVDTDGYKIVLYKPDKKGKNKEAVGVEKEIENLIKKALLPRKIKGVKKLSAKKINKIAVSFLNEVDENIINRYWKTPLDRIIVFLEEKKGVKTNSENYLFDDKGSVQLGYYDLKNETIFINREIRDTIRFPFIFAHELGHYLLHSKLKTHQYIYDNFKDSDHSLFTQTQLLQNDKHWVEWQANCFASCFLMPEKTILARLINIQTKMGISKQGRIYLDQQEINKKDFREIIRTLASFFKVSQTSVEYRLGSLEIIERPIQSKEDEDAKEFLRNLMKFKSNL